MNPARPKTPREGTHLMPVMALLSAVILWGVTFTIVKRAIEDVPPFHFIFYRFFLGSVVLWLLLRKRLGPLPRPWGFPLLVSLALLAGFYFQTWGLVHTTPSRAAFITGLSVLLVPLVGWLTRAETMRLGPVLGTLLAATGLWCLFGGETGGLVLNRGDIIVSGCALAFAGHILFVQRAIKGGATIYSLALMQCSVVAVCSAPFLILDPPRAEHFTVISVLSIIAMGTVATPAFLAQIYAQRHLTAVQTAVILAIEPGAAAAFSVAVGVEPLTAGMLIGISLLTGATVISEVRLPRRKTSPQPEI